MQHNSRNNNIISLVIKHLKFAKSVPNYTINASKMYEIKHKNALCSLDLCFSSRKYMRVIPALACQIFENKILKVLNKVMFYSFNTNYKILQESFQILKYFHV